MSLIHVAARVEVCSFCRLHARIVFSDGTYSADICNPTSATEALKKAIADGKILEVEQIGLFDGLVEFIEEAMNLRWKLAKEDVFPVEGVCREEDRLSVN